MFNKQNILKSISKPDEKLIFSKVLDKAEHCAKYFEPSFTEFLDPFKISTITPVLENNYDVNIIIFGGKNNCERRKIGFFPEFIAEDEHKFPISAIEITYNMKFSRKLKHRDFLGALMGFGISRGKIGDIFVEDNKAFIFMDSDIARFISADFCKVGKTPVKTRIVLPEDVNVCENADEVKNITAVSLRADVVLSGAFNLSRGKISELIKGQKFFLNHRVCESGAKQISEGDILTLRGVGRMEIISLIGKTKKEKFIINIRKFR